LQNLPHLGKLLCEQLAEDRSDVDAGKKIARAASLLGRAGVVAKLRMVERDSMNSAKLMGPPVRIRSAISSRSARELSFANRDELLLSAPHDQHADRAA
jgi:hypothetical protein